MEKMVLKIAQSLVGSAARQYGGEFAKTAAGKLTDSESVTKVVGTIGGTIVSTLAQGSIHDIWNALSEVFNDN